MGFSHEVCLKLPGPQWSLCSKGSMLFFRSTNAWRSTLCLCTHMYTCIHESWHFTLDIFTLSVCCRTCSASPHSKSELQLIKVQALALAAARPRCAAPGRNHSSSVIRQSPPFCLVSVVHPQVAMLCVMPTSSAFAPFSWTGEELVPFKCFWTEEEQITGMINFHF